MSVIKRGGRYCKYLRITIFRFFVCVRERQMDSIVRSYRLRKITNSPTEGLDSTAGSEAWHLFLLKYRKYFKSNFVDF